MAQVIDVICGMATIILGVIIAVIGVWQIVK